MQKTLERGFSLKRRPRLIPTATERPIPSGPPDDFEPAGASHIGVPFETAQLAVAVHLFHRVITPQRQGRIQGRRAVRFREDQSIALVPARFLRIDLHGLEIQHGQDFRHRK